NLLDCLSSPTSNWTWELGRALFVQLEQHLEATSSPSHSSRPWQSDLSACSLPPICAL
ncbi:hypothetical protein Nmel_003055, partial [Mimus melanotis]